jgi:class 3 adenylate cyclase
LASQRLDTGAACWRQSGPWRQRQIRCRPLPVGPERRLLTVMFCDLVGSTPLAARLDPEDLREVIAAYHRAVAETVQRFSGFVAKYMGDGVLVYFGYPQAREDDVEQAVRAGLKVVDAVDSLALRENLGVRIGIATGLVVVGDLIGEGAAQEQAVVGETPNLAARLQALAEPKTVLSPTRHGGWSVGCLRSTILVCKNFGVLRSRSTLGG